MSTVKFDAVGKGLPRRLSVCPSDPHYDKKAKALSGHIAVLLDGVELEEVASWDADNGVVTRRYRNRDGQFVLDEAGIPRIETLKGEVEVRWSEGSAA